MSEIKIGDRIGDVIYKGLLEEWQKNGIRLHLWECPKCSKDFKRPFSYIKSGHTTSCGCWRGKIKDDCPDKLTEHQFNIVTGSLLGDGFLVQRNSGNCSFGKAQKNIEHIQWINNEIKPFSTNKIREILAKTKPKNINGKVVHVPCDSYVSGYKTSTYCHSIFKDMRLKWYPNNKKIIPKELKLNDEILSIWYVDDGSNDYNGRRCTLATNGFSFEDVDFLRMILERDLKIKSNILTQSEQFVIRFSGKNYDKLMEIIQPFDLWKCFSYKFKYRKRILNKWKELSNDDKNQLIESIKYGVSVKDMALKYGISKKQIYYTLSNA